MQRTGQVLESVGLLGREVEVTKLHPCVGPGQLERACDGAGIGEHIGQFERLVAQIPRRPS